MIYEIRKVNVWSVAKVSFVLGGVLGFCGGLFLWMFAGLISQMPISELSDPDTMESLGSIGAMMPFLMAVLYAVLFMIANGILAGVYNLLVGMVGGIEMTLVLPAAPEVAASPWTPPAASGPPSSGWTPAPPPPPASPGPPATPGG